MHEFVDEMLARFAVALVVVVPGALSIAAGALEIELGGSGELSSFLAATGSIVGMVLGFLWSEFARLGNLRRGQEERRRLRRIRNGKCARRQRQT